VSAGRTLLVVALVLAVLAGTAFSVQNSSRSTQLSFDAGVAAWELERPVTVPALIGVSFGAGLLLGVVGMTARVARLSSRVRQLEQQAAIGSVLSDKGTDASRW
jgi:uncharacterized integral membrane protein